MDWSAVLADPHLRDLPFKIELDEWGRVIMSPASNRHGRNQMRVGILLAGFAPGGQIISECSIATAKGVRVADVVWASDEFVKRRGYATPYHDAPELCVEVISPSNGPSELAEKRRLYLEQGAKEVWFCDESGPITFFDADGRLSASSLFPGFPSQV